MESRLLWVSADPPPPNVEAAAAADWQIIPLRSDQPLGPQLAQATIAVVAERGGDRSSRHLANLTSALARTCTAAVFILPDPARQSWLNVSRRQGQFFCARADASAAELSAQFAAAAAMKPLIRNMRADLTPTGERPSQLPDSTALDEEMRLAAKIQRDFLPHELPSVGAVRFDVYYRPASWVSGDFYEVVRLDESHVGFYVVDVVGHGMPAALLTMFIKKALQTKRIDGHNYQIVAPDEAMAQLNADICDQDLSSCQFCTAVYGVLNTDTLELTYARAGHPEPLLLKFGDHIQTLNAPGGLLGVFPGEQYHSQTIKLGPGDRLLLYTDGAERALWNSDHIDLDHMDASLDPWRQLSRREMVSVLTRRVEAASEKWREDDITVLIVDVEQ